MTDALQSKRHWQARELVLIGVFAAAAKLSDRYITDPNEIVHIHQHVRVKVLAIDEARKRLSLTMIGVEQKG